MSPNTANLSNVWFKVTDLEIASVSYERQVSELVGEDEETVEFVRELEERFDEEAEFLANDDLVDEVEQFLKNLPPRD